MWYALYGKLIWWRLVNRDSVYLSLWFDAFSETPEYNKPAQQETKCELPFDLSEAVHTIRDVQHLKTTSRQPRTLCNTLKCPVSGLFSCTTTHNLCLNMKSSLVTETWSRYHAVQPIVYIVDALLRKLQKTKTHWKYSSAGRRDLNKLDTDDVILQLDSFVLM